MCSKQTPHCLGAKERRYCLFPPTAAPSFLAPREVSSSIVEYRPVLTKSPTGHHPPMDRPHQQSSTPETRTFASQGQP
jgi:hypothetical protein